MISELHPPAEVREDRQQGHLFPGLRRGVEVEHERIEVVGEVTDSEVDLMRHLSLS